MTLCSHCGKRKAKRSCPALGRRICQLCCGTLRGKSVSCPDDCEHLRKHSSYQNARVRAAEAFEDADRVLSDDRLMRLVFHIETVLHHITVEDPSFTDGAAIRALEWARAETEKTRRLILLPGEIEAPSDPAGQAVLEAVEACRFSRTVLLETEGEGYSREDKILCLKFLIQGAGHLSESRMEERAFLNFIAARMAKLQAHPA